jgi:probable HAF family extracellular repeat protein
MKTFLLKLVTVFVVASFVAFFPDCCFSVPNYVITDLGTLGGNVTSATAINDCGQITGSSSLLNGSKQPFLWANGNMQAIGNFNSPMEGFTPVAINN